MNEKIKSKLGRPKLAPERVRTKKVSIRMTEDEHQALILSAMARRTNATRIIRSRILDLLTI